MLIDQLRQALHWASCGLCGPDSKPLMPLLFLLPATNHKHIFIQEIEHLMENYSMVNMRIILIVIIIMMMTTVMVMVMELRMKLLMEMLMEMTGSRV